MKLMKDLCDSLGLKVVTFCTDFRINPGDATQHDRYLEGLAASIEEALTQVMKDAVPLLKENDMTLVLEPLNIITDHPGYHMSTGAHAFSFLQKIQDEHIKILFDLYHQQITDGNLLDTVTKNLSRIGHFHIAAVPGRIEPTIGELNYPYILKAIEKLGYEGYFGLEYMPKRDALETLREVRAAFPK